MATIYLCHRYWNPMLYILAVAFIGSRQHALLVLMHDGVHYRLLRNRRLNDWMSEVMLAWPHLVSARQYRKNHFGHHKYLNTAEDPDLKRQEGRRGVGLSAGGAELAKMLFRDAVGLNAPAMLKLAASVAAADSVPSGFLGVALRILRGSAGSDRVCGRARRLRALLDRADVHVAGDDHAHPQYRGASCDRQSEGQTAYPRTRTTQATLIERIFLAPKNVNYHIEHHFFPSVPFYRLPELHAILMSKPGYREGAHVTRTYWGVLEESVGRTPSRREDSRQARHRNSSRIAAGSGGNRLMH